MRISSRAAVLVVALALPATACSADNPMTSSELWTGIGASTAFSDEPESLAEVVEGASLIVRARITRVYAGPDTVHHPPEGEVRQPSLLVDLEPSEVLEGNAPERITVHFAMISDAVRATDNPPVDEYLWLLEPSGIDSYYMTSSFSGVIVELDGKITTPRDPGSTVTDAAWTDLDDAVDAVREAIG